MHTMRNQRGGCSCDDVLGWVRSVRWQKICRQSFQIVEPFVVDTVYSDTGRQQHSERGNEKMYKLNANDDWFNGMRFASLVEAKDQADDVAAKGITVDVIALTDRDTFRVAYTPANCRGGQSKRTTFNK